MRKAGYGALAGAVVALVFLGASASAQDTEISNRVPAGQSPLKVGPGCDGGLQYDDGSFEDGYGFSTTPSRGSTVMRFDLPGPGLILKAICICWQQLGSQAVFDYDINIWTADGPGGGPGTLIAFLQGASADGIGLSPTFHRVGLGDGLSIAGSSIYIGPQWSPSSDQNFFVCADENGPGHQPAYSSVDGGPPEIRFGPSGTAHPGYKALGIRAEVAAAGGTCVPSDTALCLNGGRFRVEATYRTQGGPVGTAHVVPLTVETGYLWFFGATNVETVVKVLDACGVNQRFWVFAGGLTDVEVVMTVTDTQTGVVKTYTNPQGAKFQPIQDTDAFATCQ